MNGFDEGSLVPNFWGVFNFVSMYWKIIKYVEIVAFERKLYHRNSPFIRYMFDLLWLGFYCRSENLSWFCCSLWRLVWVSVGRVWVAESCFVNFSAERGIETPHYNLSWHHRIIQPPQSCSTLSLFQLIPWRRSKCSNTLHDKSPPATHPRLPGLPLR